MKEVTMKNISAKKIDSLKLKQSGSPDHAHGS